MIKSVKKRQIVLFISFWMTLNNEGNQWWVRFREQTINEGGMNTIPRTWDAETGLNYNPFK